MTLYDILLPYQRRFVDAPQRNKLYLSTRQAGKSFTLAYLATQKVLTSRRGPNALALVISTGARAASEFLKKCQQMAESVGILEPSITYQASADTVRFSGGQRIVSLPSGNPAALRGYTADVILIDEAAYVERPEDVWAAIAPTLTRNRDAELVLASTPAGKASWFYQKVVEAREDPENWYFQRVTIEDAVREGLQVDVEALKRTIADPDTWAREYMCEFAQEYGVLVDTSLLQFDENAPTDRLGRFVGVDIGASNDRTAIVDVIQRADGSFYVNDIVMLRKADYQQQLQILKELNAQKRWSSGYVDAVGIGNPIAEFANKQVSARIKGFNWTAASKTPAYENMRALIFDRKLVFAPHLKDLVVSDFENVRRVVSESGKVSYEAGRNENGHSDAVSALVLALQAAKDMPHNAVAPSPAQFHSAFGKWRSRL